MNGFGLAPEIMYDLIRSVYRSTDVFCSDFEQMHPTPAAFGEYLSEIRERPGSLFLVDREGDELCGFLFIIPRTSRKLRHTADLNMGLRTEQRGRGIGGRLLSAALSQIREEHIIEIVYLMVRADNRPAVQLYKRQGFEELALLAGDTRIGEHYYDGILMRKRFSGGSRVS